MPAAHHDHGFRYEVRLSQLAPTDFIRVHCKGWGATQAVGPGRCTIASTGDTLVVTIVEQLRCRSCGQVGGKTWTPMRADPGPDARPPEPETVKRGPKEYKKR
jgi:hypothetical protein